MQKLRSEIASSSDTPKTTTQPCWPSVAKNKWKQINKQQGSNSPRQPRPSMKHSVSIFSGLSARLKHGADSWRHRRDFNLDVVVFFFNMCKYIPGQAEFWYHYRKTIIFTRFLWALWERMFQIPLHMCKRSQHKFREAKQKSAVHVSMIVKGRPQLWKTDFWKQ